MTDSTHESARIRLARSLPRLLAVPIVVGLTGAAALAAGLLVVASPAGWAVAGFGGLLVLLALAGAIVLLSVRLSVEESDVVLSWLGGSRRYPLAAGPVTRVRLRGPSPSRLRPRSGARWWGVGHARLRDEEEIELVRLARTRTAILVPTERGRLGVAPAHDEDLLAALSRAARARQRTQALAEAAPGDVEPPSAAVTAPAEPEPPPVALTGIQRALLEERLARERLDEEARAESIRLAEAAPTEAAAGAVDAATADAAAVAPSGESAPPAAGGRARRARRMPLRRPGAGAVFVLLPTIAAGLAWGIGASVGRMPASGTDLARLTSLALVLAGPATSIGAVMALAWWPRLVGLVVAGGLAASVFIGRALLGI
jgi:hypothetical protein